MGMSPNQARDFQHRVRLARRARDVAAAFHALVRRRARRRPRRECCDHRRAPRADVRAGVGGRRHRLHAHGLRQLGRRGVPWPTRPTDVPRARSLQRVARDRRSRPAQGVRRSARPCATSRCPCGAARSSDSSGRTAPARARRSRCSSARPSDGGNATVLGAPIGDVRRRRRIGFLPEDFRFYDWLTATELLELHGRLAGMAPRTRDARAPEVLESVGMSAHASRRLRGFSKGMLQRLGLAQALIHEPDLIFLDEPTSGLDPMGRRMVRDVIRAQRDRGATVFLNSHLLSEIEVTCDRVAFIKDGEIVESRDLHREGETAVRHVRITARQRAASDRDAARRSGRRATELSGGELVVRTTLDDAIPRRAPPRAVRRRRLAGGDRVDVARGHFRAARRRGSRTMKRWTVDVAGERNVDHGAHHAA